MASLIKLERLPRMIFNRHQNNRKELRLFHKEGKHLGEKEKINISKVCHQQKMNDATTHKIDKVPMKHKACIRTQRTSKIIVLEHITQNWIFSQCKRKDECCDFFQYV